MALDFKTQILPALIQMTQNVAAIQHPGGAMNISKLDQQRMQQQLLQRQLAALDKMTAKEDAKDSAIQDYVTAEAPQTITRDPSLPTAPDQTASPGLQYASSVTIPGSVGKTIVGDEQEMNTALNASLQRAFGPEMLEAKLKQSMTPGKSINVIDTTDSKARPFATTEASFQVLNQKNPGKYALADAVSDKAVDPWSNYKHAGSNLWEMTPDGPKLAISGEGPQSTKQGYDTKDKKQVFVTEKMIASDPGRYVPMPSGMKIESDGQGGFKMTTGDLAAEGQGMGLTTATQTDLQKTALATKEGIARLGGINERFKPEYQQIGTRWDALKTALKDKAGVPVDKASAELLRDFSSFKADALNNLNLYIKEITGAAMTNAEAGRITKGLPNTGSGLIDGDSPIEFKSKLDSTMSRLKSASARQFYALQKGLTKDQMFALPLESIPQIIDKRGADIENELRTANPNVTPEEIEAQVERRLKQEFGL